MRNRTYINRSSCERMIYGETYSLAQIALITDMAKTTLHNRFGFAESFSDHEIRSPDRAFVWPLMETAGAKLSAEWLSRSLVA